MVEGRDGFVPTLKYNTFLKLITHALHEEGWDRATGSEAGETRRIYSELVAAGEGDGEGRHVNR
jgi:hypothetical protein